MKLAQILKLEKRIEEQISLIQEEIERESFEHSGKDSLHVKTTDCIDSLYEKLRKLHSDLIEVRLYKRKTNEEVSCNIPVGSSTEEKSLEYAIALFQQTKKLQKLCCGLGNAKQRERVSRTFSESMHYKYATYDVKHYRKLSEEYKKLLFVLDSEIQSKNWATEVSLPKSLSAYVMD